MQWGFRNRSGEEIGLGEVGEVHRLLPPIAGG